MEMIKPTQEKKKKKVTSKRAQEIIRRRSSVLTLTATSRRKSLAVSGENQEGFEPAGSRRGSFLEPPDNQNLEEVEEEEANNMEFDPATADNEQADQNNEGEGDDNNDDDDDDDNEPKFDHFYESEHKELGEQELWNCTQPITVIKDISRKIKSRRSSERRRSSELSDSDAKDLIRLQRTVNVMKGERRKSSGEKFFWDEQTKEAPSLRAKVREAMTKDAAMNVLGLKLTTEGKNKKALKLTDYSEDELLVAFRETCAVIDDEGEEDKNVTKMDAHEAYQVLLRILRAKNKFLKKISAKD